MGVHHVVGAGGFQLCAAAEAPADARALKAGVVAGQNIDIRIAHIERGCRIGAQLFHHMQRDGCLGLGRKCAHTALYQRKAIGAKVFLDKRGCRNMILVGEHGKLNARCAQTVEHLNRAGVG